MISVLVGSFMVTMVGLLIWTYKKEPVNVATGDKLTEKKSYTTDSDLEQDNFLSALKDTEKRITESIRDAASRKEQSTGINLEPGTFL
ncbi:MAG: hypothetical protein ABIT81_01430 [Ferruginibacter sp.]